jgi:hypothetical protein
MKPAPLQLAHVCAWTCQNSSHSRRRRIAPHYLSPAEAHGALAGGEEQANQARRPWPHTRSLRAQSPAQSQQWRAELAAAGSSLDRAEIAAILAISAMQLGNQRPRKHPCCDPGTLGSSCVSRTPRRWSPPGQLTGFFWRIGCKTSHVAEGETRPIDCLVVGL